MEQTLPQGRPRRKQLASYALDNAQECLESYHAANTAVIDEYLRLRNEVKSIRIQLAMLEHSLRAMCRGLKQVYGDEDTGRKRSRRRRNAPAQLRTE